MNSLDSRKKPKIKLILIVLCLLLLASGGAITYAYTQRIWPFTKQAATSEDNSNDKSKKSIDTKRLPEDVPMTNNGKTPEKVDQTEDANNSSVLKITSTQNLGDIVRIRTLIQKVTRQGECSLRITNGGQVYSATTEVQAAASSSTCKGFDVPADSLPSGDWNISVTYRNGSEESVAKAELQV